MPKRRKGNGVSYTHQTILTRMHKLFEKMMSGELRNRAPFDIVRVRACFFPARLLILTIGVGDGVPLITARAGLMTPAESDVRWDTTLEACGRFFIAIIRLRPF